MQKLINNLQKHTIIDNFIYRTSNKKFILDTFRYKIWIFSRKTKHISNLNPLIIGGCPRSGTTLARALIGVHPNIASPKKEYNIIMWINKKDVLKNVFSFSINEINKLKNDYKDHIVFAENVLKLYLQKEKKQLVAIKHPFHIIIIDELFHFFPNMKFIHIVRDGRDTSCSLRTHPKRRIINGKIIKNTTVNPFNWCIRRWVSCINQGKKWIHSNKYIQVKYEDLVNNPLETMNIIFKFLNLNTISKDLLLDFYKYEKNEKHIQNIEVGEPLYKKTIGRWKKDMNDIEKKMFKRMAGNLLIELNYEKDLNW